ncbi:hypothetical protein diail_9047 [Diaporthe ilicicola]|nr:hypothetical protein diail_9047 [Diaporthe ilicicola]
MSAQDHYAVLGVPAGATFGEIQKAFFRLSLRSHPDKRDRSEANEAHREYVLISAAYNVLKDPESRRKYDASSGSRYRPTSTRNSGASKESCFHNQDASRPYSSQYPGNPRFYADQEEEARRRSQQARRDNRNQRRQGENDPDTDDSEDTKQGHEPYEAPRPEAQEPVSPEDKAWLRFRAAKNNVQSLVFGLKDALDTILNTVRSLRKVAAVKSRASEARKQLRCVDSTFLTLQVEIDSVNTPENLTDAQVARVDRMVCLEEHVREIAGQLKARMPAEDLDSLPEEQAMRISKILKEAIRKWVRLCH